MSTTDFDTYVVKVPKKLSKLFEQRRKSGFYTKSEAIRDAIRSWSMPSYTPSPEENATIKQSREEYKKGEYKTWDEVKTSLAS